MNDKKLILSIGLILLLFTCLPASAAKRLTFVTDPFPPYYYTENGTTKGLQYELAALVFKKMKIPFEIKFLPWKRALMLAESSQADGVFGLRQTRDRKRWLLYPEEPLMNVRTVIFHRADNPFEYNGINSLKGKTVGITKGYTYGKTFDNSTLFIKEEVASLRLNFLKLIAGRVDVVAGYKAVGVYTLQKMNLADKIVFSHTPVQEIPMYVGFSKFPASEKISKEFSRTLKEIRNSPECLKLMKRLQIPVEITTPCYE
ncbi:substrate-binding periplasmic protein [Maridesulfovibrio hydrothermalis]|uniref:Extracellular solute-binding protein family 3 n=1 Tax=Maridesulfovibrio hydrothermalis AM13 = DSM 14728 TaxID=1121451 RepID=L0RHL5_9BACT|nr:transporter substrate-binding domain-containing protein [Maridesulfovibrio hydrothermalis]CCO25071.1 Extracellular solute-binding protein family 3 [Maridesulfovibrio hydrothermalis AM13 = DSM 14728]